MRDPLPGEDADVVAAMNAVRRIVRALRVSSRAAEKAIGVSGAQLFVLRELAGRPGRRPAAPSIAELARLTATDPSSVSVVVSRLAARGLVARRTSEADARRAEVVITAAGRALLRRSPASIQARMIDAIAALPAARRREMVAGLEAIVHALGASDHEASMFFEDGKGGDEG